MIENIFDTIEKLIADFSTYSRSYPVVAGAVSIWLLGTVSYFTRNVPGKLYAFIEKQSCTQMTLVNTSRAYHSFLNWMVMKGYTRNIRSLKISSGRWGEDNNIKSIGYGNHYFIHNWHIMKINMTRLENGSVGSQIEKDEITITTLGRSHKVFDQLFEEINDVPEDPNNVAVYSFKDNYWNKTSDQRKRYYDTVFLDKDVKENIIDHISMFVDRESWYLENGLPYHTGILLYGTPGSGKTSIVKAIASELSRELYVLNASRLWRLGEAIQSLPEKSILLVEDIDAEVTTHTRKDILKDDMDDTDRPILNNNTQSMDTILQLTNISDILNSIDGIIVNHGRILIATTNHIEKLDPALLRSGRFDLKIELGYVTRYIIDQFFNRYYSDFEIPPDFILADNVTSAQLQFLILENLDNPEMVLHTISKNEHESHKD